MGDHKWLWRNPPPPFRAAESGCGGRRPHPSAAGLHKPVRPSPTLPRRPSRSELSRTPPLPATRLSAMHVRNKARLCSRPPPQLSSSPPPTSPSLPLSSPPHSTPWCVNWKVLYQLITPFLSPPTNPNPHPNPNPGNKLLFFSLFPATAYPEAHWKWLPVIRKGKFVSSRVMNFEGASNHCRRLEMSGNEKWEMASMHAWQVACPCAKVPLFGIFVSFLMVLLATFHYPLRMIEVVLFCTWCHIWLISFNNDL